MFLIYYYNNTNKKPKKTNNLNIYYYSRFKYNHYHNLLKFQFQKTLTNLLYTYYLSKKLQQKNKILSINSKNFQKITNNKYNI